ncbi:ankyrin repeat-containing protein [Cotonvirus japonicus]|uniref:Ankyrin repeat-containing protein n=1 Tax=Cotonvirus japonicus TaxID=2811091 RepID=A0ABM7NR87_9VIRU|nr:ankyrin repeat-containing protein [Cotonvirus japonicus]BCS82671.1 ankyrin repeat-containing protein [Cotonvirus japonicus]
MENIFPQNVWINIINHTDYDIHNLILSHKYFLFLVPHINVSVNIIKLAIIKGELKILQYINMLKSQKNKLIENKNFKTISLDKCLELSCEYGHIHIVDYFASLGADAKNPFLIQIASHYGYTWIIQYLSYLNNDNTSLINYHMKNIVDTDMCRLVYLSVKRKIKLDQQNNYAILYAICHNNIKLFKQLISDQPNIFLIYDIIIENSLKNGHIELIDFLLSINKNYIDMHSIIKIALKHDNDATIKHLINIKKFNMKDDNLIKIAAKHGNWSIVKLLEKHGFDIRVEKDYVLKCAIKFKNQDMIEYLLSKNISFTKTLLMTCKYGHYEIFRNLILRYKNIDNIFYKLFKLACKFGHYEIAKFLTSVDLKTKNTCDKLLIFTLKYEFIGITKYVIHKIFTDSIEIDYYSVMTQILEHKNLEISKHLIIEYHAKNLITNATNGTSNDEIYIRLLKRACEIGNLIVIKLLIELNHQFNIFKDFDIVKNQLMTKAFEIGNSKIIVYLVESSININLHLINMLNIDIQ